MCSPASEARQTADIIIGVSKTSVEINRDIAAQAADILGTATLRDTIDAALREIVDARRRLKLIAMLSEPGCFDFDTAEDAWGGEHTQGREHAQGGDG